MNKDFYKVLGVSRDASKEDIRKAYLKLTKQYHPDHQAGKSEAEQKEATQKMQEINEAYETLSDPQKKEQYDLGGNSFNSANFRRGPQYDFNDDDIESLFGRGWGHFGFKDFFKQSRPKNDINTPKDGQSVRVKATFTFEDMLYGATKEFVVNVNDPCDHCHGSGAEDGVFTQCQVCHGTGYVRQQTPFGYNEYSCPYCHQTGKTPKTLCKHCNGTRVVNVKRNLKVDIPQGFESGCTIRVSGQGCKGINGGQNGDILIVTNVEENKIFERNGLDLITIVSISPIKAILGGDTDVMTPWGVIKIKVPEGVSNKTSLRVKNMGIRTPTERGDLYVVFNIETLQNITDEQKEILVNLDKIITNNNTPEIVQMNKNYEEFKPIMEKHQK